MNADKNYSDKIARLFEALSDLSGEDLEEAKTILRNAGKDPEEVVRAGIEKLLKIQASFSKRKPGTSGEPVAGMSDGFVLTLDAAGKTIHLEAPGTAKNRILTATEVYGFFISKTGLGDIPAKELSVSREAGKIRFYKILRNISFELTMGAGDADLSSFLQWHGEKQRIGAEAIHTIIQTGYYILQGNCYPVDAESAGFARQMTAFVSEGKMPLKKALDLFAVRADLPWVSFLPEEMDLSVIFNTAAWPPVNKELFVRALYDYQQDGLRWLQYCVINRIGGILGDDMGLGKTAQTIALISWIAEKNIFENILIVVPGTLLENWKREFAFFAPSLVPLIHHGSRRTGSILALKQQRIVLTSYSMIVNDVFLFDKINWGLILADEASLIKNPDAERRIALKKIPSEVRIAMSGTPVENSLTDLWSLADFVYPGFFGTRAQFQAKYTRKDLKSTLENPKLEELRTSLSHIMLRRKKEAVLPSLPEKINIHQAVVMSEREAALYEEQRSRILGEKDRSSIHILTMIQDLRQFTTHPLLKNNNIQNAGLEELKNSSVKFSRTVEILDEIYSGREKVLIFTEYLHMIDVMQKTFSAEYQCPVYTIDGRLEMSSRQANIDKFSQHSGFGIMVLNPRTAGMGLNITAATHVIHYTRQWNPALEEQATARAHRNGQTKGVNVYYIYYADTIEEVIDERLRDKQALTGEVVEATATDMSMEEYLLALNKSPIKK